MMTDKLTARMIELDQEQRQQERERERVRDAAEELLEALQESLVLLQVLDFSSVMGTHYQNEVHRRKAEFRKKARAAIAKATGDE